MKYFFILCLLGTMFTIGFCWYSTNENMESLLVESQTPPSTNSGYPEGEVFEWVVRVSNRKRLPLLVQSVETSCGCTSISDLALFPLTLGPLETKEVRFHIDTSSMIGAKHVSVYFSSKKFGVLKKIGLRHEFIVRCTLHSDPNQLNLGIVRPGQEVVRTIYLGDELDSEASRLEGIDPSTGRVEILGIDRIDNGRISYLGRELSTRFRVTLKFTADTGATISKSIDDFIVLRIVSLETRIDRRIPIMGRVEPEIELRPNVAAIKDLNVDSSIFLTLNIPGAQNPEIQSCPEFFRAILSISEKSLPVLSIGVDPERAKSLRIPSNHTVELAYNGKVVSIPIVVTE